MKVDWNSKYTTISVYTIITFAVCLALVLVAGNFSEITGVLGAAVKTISPVIWGIAIAYLLNPVMIKTENFLKKHLERKKKHPRLCRVLSTAVAIIFGLAVVAGLMAILVPQIYESLLSIFDNAQNYMNNIYNFVNSTLSEYPEIVTNLTEQLDNIKVTVTNALNDIIPKMGDLVVKIKDSAIELLIGIKDFALGFIIAVYLLYDKEKFIALLKKVSVAFLPKAVHKELFRLCDRTNRSISGFISGKILDSFIIGMICFICMTVMKLEYPLLISTIVGVTNVIPFFGPFFGAIPSALLIFIATPSKTIPFILLILAIQQFDGNILGPHILGDSTGLPAFWVMFAIFIGGGMFGFAGMLLGVPVFAVIYAVVQEITEFLLTKKGLPVDDAEYYPKPHDKPKKSGNVTGDKNLKTKKGGTS